MPQTKTLIPIKMDKVVLFRTYTCVVVGTSDKKFPIYTDLNSGKIMQSLLTGTQKERPQIYNLYLSTLSSLDISIKHATIVGYEDDIFYCQLFLSQKKGDITEIVAIDTKPSDCIILSLYQKTPLYCNSSILEKTIPYQE